MEKNFNPYLISKALEIAAENPTGFTVSPDMTEFPETGYAVAVDRLQNTGTLGFLRSLLHALANGYHFGGWWDKETDVFYWDAVKVFPMGQLKEATQFAHDNQQIAFYDIANGVEIRL